MDRDSTVNNSLSQFQHRITSLEDLLRRNEGTLSAVLGRMKGAEVAVSNVNKVTNDIFPRDLRSLSDEQMSQRRRVEALEHGTRPMIADAIATHDTDVRSRLATLEERTKRDMADLGAGVNSQLARDRDTNAASMSKLSDGLQALSNETRVIGQDTKWACEGVRDLNKRHSEIQALHERRMDGIDQSISVTRQQLAELITSSVDRATRELRDEINVLRLSSARLQGGHEELVGVVARLREDTVKALSQAATNMRGLDETTQSLEALLKAEVKARQQRSGELNERLVYVENSMAMQANTSESKLQALDDEIGRAIMDVHRTAQADTRAQLERAWRMISELREQTEKLQASQRSHALALLQVVNQSGGGKGGEVEKDKKEEEDPVPSSPQGSGGGGVSREEEDYQNAQIKALAALASSEHKKNTTTSLDAQSSPSATLQSRLQLQWQADLAALKRELLEVFDGDLAKARESAVLVMEQQEELAVVVAGLEKDMTDIHSELASGEKQKQKPTTGIATTTGAATHAAGDQLTFATKSEIEDLERKIAALMKTSSSAPSPLSSARIEAIEKKLDSLSVNQDHLIQTSKEPPQVDERSKSSVTTVDGGAVGTSIEISNQIAMRALILDASSSSPSAMLSSPQSINTTTATNNTISTSTQQQLVMEMEATRRQHKQAIEVLTNELRMLDERTATSFVEVDSRLQALEEKTETLQSNQKHLEESWGQDQVHLESCVTSLRDDLKVLVDSLGMVNTREDQQQQEQEKQPQPIAPLPSSSEGESTIATKEADNKKEKKSISSSDNGSCVDGNSTKSLVKKDAPKSLTTQTNSHPAAVRAREEPAQARLDVGPENDGKAKAVLTQEQIAMDEKTHNQEKPQERKEEEKTPHPSADKHNAQNTPTKGANEAAVRDDMVEAPKQAEASQPPSASASVVPAGDQKDDDDYEDDDDSYYRRTPVETHDVGIGTTPVPITSAAHAFPDPRPPSVPRGVSSSSTNATARVVNNRQQDDDAPLPSLSPSRPQRERGGVVEADVDLEHVDVDQELPPTQKKKAGGASVGPTNPNKKASEAHTKEKKGAAAVVSKKAAPPTTAPNKGGGLTPRSNGGAPASSPRKVATTSASAAAKPTPSVAATTAPSPVQQLRPLNGTQGRPSPTATPTPSPSPGPFGATGVGGLPTGLLGGISRGASSSNSKNNMSTANKSDPFGSPSSPSKIIKGGAKSAYDHTAPGWARPR